MPGIKEVVDVPFTDDELRVEAESVDARRTELIGYTDRWSVTPGEAIRCMVSSASAYRAELVRLRHGSEDPAGPGFRESVVSGALSQRLAGREQRARAGSCIVVDPSPRAAAQS